MKIQQQVTSVSLSNKLKDLNVQTPSLFFREWRDAGEDEIDQLTEPSYYIDGVNCYTVAELGEMLGYENHPVNTRHTGGKWVCSKPEWHWEDYADTEADARATLLIYLLENKLVTL